MFESINDDVTAKQKFWTSRDIFSIRTRYKNNARLWNAIHQETLARFGLGFLSDADKGAFLAFSARPREVRHVHDLVYKIEALCPQLANDEFKGAEEVSAVVITAKLLSSLNAA